MTTVTPVETNVERWLKGPYDEKDKAEIRRLQKEDPETLYNAFYKNLEFGTGGMRGLMGVGTNRINRYTVAFVTQAIANYLHTLPELPKKVAICFDSRHHSKEFAEEVAKVFAANEIEVFLYKELRPVALISFAVRKHQCGFGVMITASHNPAVYNGYKVYGPDGSQVLWPHDENIIAATQKINDPTQVKKTESLQDPRIHFMGEEMDKSYLDIIYRYLFHPGDNQKFGEKLKIVYTPLHGAGMTIIPRALKESGFTNVTLVQEQTTFDGDFPTVKVPNPEEQEALSKGIALLIQSDGECLIATDPDTDRLAVVIREGKEIVSFNGNEIAVMLLEHLCSSLKKDQRMPPKPVAIKTIVTTELFRAIATHYNVQCLEVLTGFKYIGQKITQFEEEKNVASHHFLFGAEESYGYLVGDHVRDKDAIISALFVAELALQMKLQNKTLRDFLYEIYKKYGIWREQLLSLTLPDREGLEKMQQMMSRLRSHPPQAIEGKGVLAIEDYLKREVTYMDDQRKEPLTLPKSNVLRFWLADGSSLVIRPSGTEPKIKIYCSIQDKHHIHDQKQLQQTLMHVDQRAFSLLHAFKELL
jgi:phosphoglucomutase/phosphomannomutase